MAAELPTAFKVLRITSPAPKPLKSKFLELPRELRDIIYTYALDDVPLLERLHVPKCEFYGPNADFLTPPAVKVYTPRETWIPRRTEAEDECRRTCVIRQGFGLWTVSKQVHAEVTQMCSQLVLHLTFLHTEDMFDALENLPQATLSRIETLDFHNLWGDHHYRWIETDRVEQERVLKVISSLPKLKKLVLPYVFIRGGPHWLVEFTRIRTLETIHIMQIPLLGSVGPWCKFRRPAFEYPYTLAGKTVNIQQEIPCARGVCPRGYDTSQPAPLASTTVWCRWCLGKVEYIGWLADSMHGNELHERLDYDYLENSAPKYSIENPCRDTIHFRGDEYDVLIYELPSVSPAVRRRRVAEEAMALAKAKGAHSRGPIVQGSVEESDVDEGDEYEADFRPCKSATRSHTKMEVRRDGQAQKKAMEERSRRNANKEKREQAGRKSEAKDERGSLQVLKTALVENKKAARKRNAKR
ncbi:hypothetical protein CB0940_04320 [Cercospora beticola]|uniref:Uncharacterized protein n=1 Tax=Cercospora beticola TaxID=122368 RepID=A0A2G5HKF8_CERBT|nr:hypothetical protein CB0940_04320 [Cercospora beticola]PIA93057.1 hypothetical protein CB0940_04320 [Cercospora beticola]WPB01552.1 hypothetical protein RHO25_006179 [Cercospora beticola]CAK1363656.1 unnamed protein product [Cercospora beticola]